jgi:hypothetical protein
MPGQGPFPRARTLAAFCHALTMVTLRLARTNITMCEDTIDGHPLGRVGYLLRGPIATPLPQARIDDHPESHRGEHEIPTALSPMRVLFDHNHREPPVEEMPEPSRPVG